MDSGNSSSMQSNSSGGDDQEYDSRSFFHHTPPPPPQTTSPLIFSPDPNFLQPFSDYRDPVFINWPNSGSNEVAAVAIAHPNYTSFPGGEGRVIGERPSSSAQRPPPPQTSSVAAAPPPPPKNPKKRTRASRRAPTTVLTTDTSNFRAMVQEFTGIPAPPFSAAASATSAYSRLLGGPFRPATQRMSTLSQPNNIFSSSLLNMSGQTDQNQLLGSGQQMGLPKFPTQPDPILAFQSHLLQQQRQQQQSDSTRLFGYQQDQPPPSNVAGSSAAAFGSIGNEEGSNNIYSSTNKE